MRPYLPHIAILLVTTAEGGMNTIMSPYLDAAHYSVEQIGFITALFALLQLVSRLPSGAMYTGARARRLVIVSVALFIFSTSGYALSENPIWVLFLTVVHGFAFGAISTFMFPIAIQLKTRNTSHGASMGWYTAALSAGYALGSFIGGFSADYFDFFVTFAILGALPLLTILLTFLFPKIEEVPVAPKESLNKEQGWGRLLSAIPSITPTLAFATLVAFYINFIDDGFGTFFPLFGLGIGMSLATIGVLKGLKSAIGIGVRAIAGGVFRFIDYRMTNHLSVISWSLVVFILPWVREEWIFVLLFLFMGVARSLSRVTSATIVAEERGADAAGIGVASGFYNMGLDVGALAGPLVAGVIARVTDIATMMHVISIAMVAIYFGALLWIARASPSRVRVATEVDG